MRDCEFVDLAGVTRVRPSRQAAEHANRWALTHGLPVPYPDLGGRQSYAVPATWGKRRIELERGQVARQMTRHGIECSQCARAAGDLSRSCQQGYDLARQHQALTDAWHQARGRQPADSQQSALW